MAYCRSHGEISNMGGTDDTPAQIYPKKKITGHYVGQNQAFD